MCSPLPIRVFMLCGTCSCPTLSFVYVFSASNADLCGIVLDGALILARVPCFKFRSGCAMPGGAFLHACFPRFKHGCMCPVACLSCDASMCFALLIWICTHGGTATTNGHVDIKSSNGTLAPMSHTVAAPTAPMTSRYMCHTLPLARATIRLIFVSLHQPNDLQQQVDAHIVRCHNLFPPLTSQQTGVAFVPTIPSAS